MKLFLSQRLLPCCYALKISERNVIRFIIDVSPKNVPVLCI